MKQSILAPDPALPGTPFNGLMQNAGLPLHDVKSYDSLLHQIAENFGFRGNEAAELVKQACRQIRNDNSMQSLTGTKMQLSKAMVHLCVFKLSCKMFSQKEQVIHRFADVISANPHLETMLLKMPLSYRVVYILFQVIGFTKKEIAEMLNSNLVQVTERLEKAMRIIAR